MLEKYRATLTDNYLEWEADSPKEISKNGSIKVDVIVVSQQPKLKKPNGKKMAEALAKIAARGGIASIKDPVKWQREIRKDRPLPGR